MAAPVAAVVGMAALRRDINRMAADESGPLYRAIKAAGKEAAEPVAARARGDYPHDTGTLAGDVRTSGTKTGAAVRVGRKTIRYAGWIEFGGHRPDGSSREYVAAGRYLFPAAVAMATQAADLYSTAIDRAMNSPDVWTNTSDDGGKVHD